MKARLYPNCTRDSSFVCCVHLDLSFTPSFLAQEHSCFFYRPVQPSAAAGNFCDRHRGRELPARIVRASSQLPIARPSDLPLITPTQSVSAGVMCEELPSHTLLENANSGDKEEARIYQRGHILILDTRNDWATQSLLRMTLLCGIAVCGFEPSGTTKSISGLQDVDASLRVEPFLIIRASSPIRSISRMGNPITVPVDLQSSRLLKYPTPVWCPEMYFCFLLGRSANGAVPSL